jgi:polyhydroxybutyrate depolymerase
MLLKSLFPSLALLAGFLPAHAAGAIPPPLPIPFIRGDVDGNELLELTDAVRIFRALFLGMPAPVACEDAEDSNDDGAFDISDGIYLLIHLFLGRHPPPPPGTICLNPDCSRKTLPRPGFDPTTEDPFPCGDAIRIAGDRPPNLFVPSTYDHSQPTPFVIALHAGGWTGSQMESYLQFKPLAEAHRLLYAFPDGSILADTGDRGWYATDIYDGLFAPGVDDSAYLRRVIDDVKAHYNVDSKRVFLTGLSNGGFMCYRMACEHADSIAAIASISGATYLDATRCTPSGPVHVVEIHGTSDCCALYEGGILDGDPNRRFPGADLTVEQWARFNGCSQSADSSPPPFDLEASVPGEETTVKRYTDVCNTGGSAELWTIVGGGHIPSFTSSSLILDWLLAHPKP